jgi:long-chain acyl-CoA synthetase
MVSGFSVFPTEIEDVIAEHSAVEACAVAGVPHSYRGETVKAFVVVRPDMQVTEEELRRFCAARLVEYKIPSEFEFRADLPRNMLGKVLRRVLRDEHERLRGHSTVSARTSPDAFVAELERLSLLHSSGALTDDEFAAAKARLLER